MRRGKHQLVGEAAGFVEEMHQRGNQRVDATLLIAPFEHAIGSFGEFPIRGGNAAACSQLAPETCGDGMDQRVGADRRKVVEGNQALTEAVAAAAPAEDKRHRGCGHRSIIMADETLQHTRLAAPAARSGGGPDPLFVGAPKEQCHKACFVKQGGCGQRGNQRGVAFVIGRQRAVRRFGADGVRGVPDETVEHRGHQRAFLFGQALVRIEKEVPADRGQPPAPCAARSHVPVRCRSSNRPFFRHHQPAIIRFQLTSRQLEANGALAAQ